MYVPTCLFLLMLVCTPQPVDADQLHLADTCETLYGYRPYAYTTSYPVFDVGNIGGFVRLPGVANNNVLLNRKNQRPKSPPLRHSCFNTGHNWLVLYQLGSILSVPWS